MDKLNVFIIEDELWIRKGLIFRFSQMEEQVRIAGSSDSWDENLIAQICALPRPLAVFCDIILNEKNGLDLLERLHAASPDIMSCIISAYSDFSYAQKAIEVGVKRYLVKPITPAALRDVVDFLYAQAYPRRKTYLNEGYLERLRNWNSIPETHELANILLHVFEPESEATEESIFKDDLKRVLESISVSLNHLGYKSSIFSEYADSLMLLRHESENTGAWIKKISERIIEEINHTVKERCSDSAHILYEVKAYIKNHCCEDITLISIAEKFYVSPSWLSRMFKQHCGQGIHEYMTGERIRFAANLIQNSDISLNEVAERANFGDASYFAKVFKRITGTTPGQYRREKRQEADNK